MKIRIKGNSVRLRLTKTDVRNLGDAGIVKETTSFGTSVLKYELQRAEQDTMTTSFENNTITVFMPSLMVSKLVTTQEISFDAKQNIGNDEILYILVEKDFQCLDHTTEDQSDMYINPNKTC